jgi:DUF971 family protein
MTTIPTDICAVREQSLLAVTWTDRQAELPFVFLRGQCECAHCVNEWTGERMLDLATIPADIAIEKLEQVGGYAIRISWSDGHNSGLYTWDRLRKIAEDR